MHFPHLFVYSKNTIEVYNVETRKLVYMTTTTIVRVLETTEQYLMLAEEDGQNVLAQIVIQ
jgi:hypothetical protein